MVLNACQGGTGSEQDIFSSTASILVQRRIPAVLAMQYEITDKAAIELSRSFYEALADGLPVDSAVTEARQSITFAMPDSIEWVTPVLYMRAPNGQLFTMQKEAKPTAQSTPSEPKKTQKQSNLPISQSSDKARNKQPKPQPLETNPTETFSASYLA